MSHQYVAFEISVNRKYNPPPLINIWLRYFLGLTVGVSVGLSPYLGLLNVPLFRPLLDLIPLTLQNTLIPLSSALMGLIAVAVQWQFGEKLGRKRLNALFVRSFIFCIVTFFALTIVHTFFVVNIPIKAGTQSVSVLVGYSRPLAEPCMAGISDEACIELLSFDPAEISSFWGDRQIRIAKLLLFGSYLSFTSAFAILIGLIVVKNKQSNRSARKLSHSSRPSSSGEANR